MYSAGSAFVDEFVDVHVMLKGQNKFLEARFRVNRDNGNLIFLFPSNYVLSCTRELVTAIIYPPNTFIWNMETFVI